MADNIDIKYDPTDNVVVIRAKLTAGTPSASGKTLVVATTKGFVPVVAEPGQAVGSNLKVSLNIIKSIRS